MDEQQTSIALPDVTPSTLDGTDDAALNAFCLEVGASLERVREAIAAVGPMRAAVSFYLRSRSAWSRPVTDEMKVAFADRRRARAARHSKAGRVKVAGPPG